MSSSPPHHTPQRKESNNQLSRSRNDDGDDIDNNADDKKPAATAVAADNNNSSNPREAERQRALAEAARVLEHVDCSRLDAFHLLGVVADPRGPAGATTSAAAIASNSYHGRYTTSEHGTAPTSPPPHATDAAAAASSGSSGGGGGGIFGAMGAGSYYYYQQWESTLSQMTGQMEALNLVLEDWSRYIVEEGDVEPDLPPSQLRELPPDLAHLDTSQLDQYLAASGRNATAFYQILAEQADEFDKNHRLWMLRTSTVPMTESTGDGSGSDAAAAAERKSGMDETDLVDVSDIPEIFFDPNFDLTNPATFCNLLLDNANDGDGDDCNVALTSDTNTDGPVHTWFPLPPPDALGGHLDMVELALLQQVRANSGQFFAESQRFALLQEWIDGLLREVTALQSATEHVQQDLLQPLRTVPVADAQRAELRQLDRVLELAEDMFLCKHGLGGVLSSQDDLTAIEQISYGRRLLEGTRVEREEDDDDDDNDSGDGFRVELGRLHAFKTVSDQLNQYEQLVVSNLRDELVEMFLSWNNSNTSSSSAAYGTTTASPSSSSSQQQQPIEPHVRERVTEIAGALRRCRALGQTKEAFATRLQDVTRMTVRTIVGEFAADVAPNGAVQSVAMSTSSMTLPTFMDCLDMLFEQLLGMLTSAANVDKFLVAEGLSLQDGEAAAPSPQSPPANGASGDATSSSADSALAAPTPLHSVVVSTAELMSKSISELLRIRKDAHALILLDEMKALWDVCTGFANDLENLSGSSGNTSALRSTLLAQAKAFVERKHESNMSALAAALDSERWVQCEVSVERQDALNRLCSGRSLLSPRKGSMLEITTTGDPGVVQKQQEIEAEGTRYKVVWSCLLLVEMVLNDIATAAHFSSLASSLVGKISELLRLFNSRTTQLVLGAGAIHSHAKLKSINAKHLSLVTQCLGMVIAILPHIRAALMAQLPKKQHTLLTGLDQIRKEYGEHNEKVLNKFVSIIGGIIEHGLAKKIPGIDFDQRAQTIQAVDGVVPCCVFLEGVSTNTRKMHQVLFSLLPPDHLKDTFSRIFAFIDTKVPALFIAAANIQPLFQKQSTNSPKKSPAKSGQPTFVFPKTEEGKRQFLLEVEAMTKNLNGLDGVHPWDFTVTNVLERRLEYSLADGPMALVEGEKVSGDPAGEEATQETSIEVSTEQPVGDSDNENAQIVDEKAANGSIGSTDDEGAETEPTVEKKEESVLAAIESTESAAARHVSAETTTSDAASEEVSVPDQTSPSNGLDPEVIAAENGTSKAVESVENPA